MNNMWLHFFFVQWMACLLAFIFFCIVVLNLQKLGIIGVLVFRLSVILFAATFLISAYTSMSKEKIGATCEDGWKSESISSGTCSHHGGVETWKYKYWFDK